MLVMAKRVIENSNFAMPPQVATEFRRMGNVLGEKNKMRWVVATAAVLRLLELPDGERSALFKRVMAGRKFPDDFDVMIAEAKRQAEGKPPLDATAIEDEPISPPAPPKERDRKRVGRSARQP